MNYDRRHLVFFDLYADQPEAILSRFNKIINNALTFGGTQFFIVQVIDKVNTC